MRIAAALILTLASSVALADQPAGFTATDDLWQFGGRTSATEPQRQPISGYEGDAADGVVDGDDFLRWQRSGIAPAENGYDADSDVEGNGRFTWPSPDGFPDVRRNQSTCSPSYGATYGSVLDTMMEEECGT